MSDSEKGLFTRGQLSDIIKLVGSADALLDNAQFRRDMGDIHNLSLKNPITDFENYRQNGVFDEISDDEYMAFMEQTEFMSETLWGGHPSIAINKEKMVEELLKCALELQAIANRCIRSNALCQAYDEWHELASEFGSRKNNEELHDEVLDAIKAEGVSDEVATEVASDGAYAVEETEVDMRGDADGNE